MGMMKRQALDVVEAQLPNSWWTVIVTGSKVTGQIGAVMSEEGQKYWVVWSEYGDTSTRFNDGDEVPGSVKIFNSVTDAKDFADKWLGHPWWCVPNGEYEVVEIKQKYKQVCDGWEVV